MAWVVADSAVAAVVQVVEPELRALVPQPEMVVPSAVKLTVPVGVPPDEETVAVKVTAVPYVEGLAPEAVTVVVVDWLTVWVTALEVAAA